MTVHDNSQVNQVQRNVNSNNNSVSGNSSNQISEHSVTRHAAERTVPVYVQPKSDHMNHLLIQADKRFNVEKFHHSYKSNRLICHLIINVII